ncbi:MAG TPA: M56 family metallopeptidase [Candidatus Aquilonibacter sp.]|nr:M56 family metallopeptidase [Candidatus Aquilonibacter sp.]
MDRLLLECTLRAALLVLGTAVVLHFMRIRSAAARHIAWTAIMVLMLALPIWITWGPILSLPIIPVQPKTNASYAISHATILSATALPASRVSPWELLLVGTYLLGFCLLAVRLAMGTIRARRLIRQPSNGDGIRVSELCTAPVTVGFLQPVVVLPENWREWSEAQFAAIMAHEGAHVRRRDSLVRWIALLNRAVYWFHPAAWWLERTLSALAEEACDDAVLSRGHNPKEYAECLMDMARAVARSGLRVNAAGMGMPGELLPRRIRKIMEVGQSPSVSRGRLACALILCAMISSAFTAGKLGPVRRSTANHFAAISVEGNPVQDNEHDLKTVGLGHGSLGETLTVSVNEGPQYRVGKVGVSLAPAKVTAAPVPACKSDVDVENSSIEKGYDAVAIIRAKVVSAGPGAWVNLSVTPSYTYTKNDGTQLGEEGAPVLIKIDSSVTSEGEAELEHALHGCSSREPCQLNNVSAKANTSCADK